jgi:hypothetical protein
MGFETVVLAAVAEALGTDTKAEFAHGTLFIDHLTSGEALFVREMLKELTTSNVQMGRLGEEVFFDFTA